MKIITKKVATTVIASAFLMLANTPTNVYAKRGDSHHGSGGHRGGEQRGQRGGSNDSKDSATDKIVDQFAESSVDIAISGISLVSTVILQSASELSSGKSHKEEDNDLEALLGHENTVAIKNIQSIDDTTQRWVLERGSDKALLTLEVKSQQLMPPEKQPMNVDIAISNETYGIMLHHNNRVVAFFMNTAGSEKFGFTI